jgi:streptogramin lyase
MRHCLLVLAGLLAAVAAHAQSTCAHRMFVSGYTSTVHVFDACTGAYLRDLDSGTRIRGAQAVKLGPDGLLHVTSEMSQQILRYRNDTLDFVDAFATLPDSDPTGFAFAPGGDVYVAAFRTNQVRRLSAAGAPIDIPVPAGSAGLVGPDNGITFAPDGNLYVPGYYSHNVIRHDPRTGATTVAVAARAQGLFNTRGLLPDRAGTALFVTGEGSGQLLRVDLATGAVTVLARNLVGPTGIDYAPDGDLLVLHGNSVVRFDPATGAARGTLVALASTPVSGGTYLAVIAKAAPAKSAVIEYYNEALDHYFVSALPADIAALDSGTLRGWARTGLSFGAYLSPAAGTSPVCRYYLPPASGDSHFYSASPAECAQVGARFPTFVLEAADVMHIALPDTATGECPPETVKVYRLWNNRTDSNHRYTTEPGVKAAMLARGYVAEGYGPDATIMCAAG